MRRIDKPWGAEEIITLTDRYCFKRLFLKAGHKTSLQYHKLKHETMYFLSGKAWLEVHSADGSIDRRLVSAGDFAEMKPLTVHRVSAEEDTFYVEASTPELEDVVRLQDDYQRI
jgi:mannose-6-phosphate isomerase-like protein (cupin superfamily)